MRGERYFGWLMVGLAAVGWSTAGLFTRLVSEDVWTILFWRGVFAGIAIGIITLIQYRRRSAAIYHDLGWAGVLLALVSASAMLTFIGGLKLTTVANVYAIYATVPFVTAACAYLFLGERATAPTLIASFIAAAGVIATLDFTQLGVDLAGQFLALLMTIGMALMTVILRWRRDVPMIPALGLSAWIAAGTSALFCAPLDVSLHDFVVLALFGVTQSAVGLILFGIGSRMAPPAEVALIGLIDVPLGPFWVWLLLGETPAISSLAGGAVVLAAVAGHMIYELARARPTIILGRPLRS